MPTRLPIRLRITVWYFAVLAACLSLFGLATFYGMRASILVTVDENLEDQAEGTRELIQRSAGKAELAQALRPIEDIRAGSDLLQVSDAAGQWIYRSRTMAHFGPAAAGNVNEPRALTARNKLACITGHKNLSCPDSGTQPENKRGRDLD